MVAARRLATLALAGLLGLALGCRSSMSYYNEGVAELERRNYEAAIELFTEALDADPRSHLALVNRGYAYLETQRLHQALEDYDRAIRLLEDSNTPNPWFYNRRGEAYYMLGRYAEALADWRRAKDLEDRRAAKGIKVRVSADYLAMQQRREELMVDAERQVALAPPLATAIPTTPPVLEPASTPAAQPSPAPEIAAEVAREVPSPEQELALAEARLAHEAARLEAEARAAAAAAPPAPPAPTGAEIEAALAEARALHGAARAQAEARAAAAQPAPPPAGPSAEEVERALAEARLVHGAARAEAEARAAAAQPAPPPAGPSAEEVERALAEARLVHEAARAEAEARAALAAAPAAAVPAPGEAQPAAAAPRPRPIADLSGTWVRDDEYTFTLLDDGRRVVGEIVGTEDFSFYEVTLEWTSDRTLTGYAVLKENLSPCKFETSIAWSVDVVDEGTLAARTEEVGWDAECHETERTWGRHTFTRLPR
ncbi:MAG: hypothetical protein KatS3mg102_1721 [Planctomycetota bacterium]|nr:MAG: hypothetical protein KatS3mg102_1721 [Planctomycetota bacterium]